MASYNAPLSPLQRKVLLTLELLGGWRSIARVAHANGLDYNQVYHAMSSLYVKHLVQRQETRLTKAQGTGYLWSLTDEYQERLLQIRDAE